MKFAHLGDIHLGAWRYSKLRDANLKSFVKAIDLCIHKKVDFVIISGDLFDTALPAIDNVREAVKKLMQLKRLRIPVYIIAGSHDYSVSGKTMLDVLEHAELVQNVCRVKEDGEKIKLIFTVDTKTGAKLTGLPGRKGMLEKNLYEKLDRTSLDTEEGYKIFLFHTAIAELKPKKLEKMEAAPVSMLPSGFDYYAGGHVHIVRNADLPGYPNLVYPGPIFPNSFAEIEELGSGGFYLVEVNNRVTELSYEPIVVHNTQSIKINCNGKKPPEIFDEILLGFKNKEFLNTIVTIRLHGRMGGGKISDIDFKTIFDTLYSKSAYYVMKSTTMLETQEFQEEEQELLGVDDIEASIIAEHLGQSSMKFDIDKIKEIMNVLSIVKEDGEKVNDYERRILTELNKVVGLEE